MEGRLLSLERQNALRELYRQTHPGWQPATEVFAGKVRHWLEAESRVLDLGCGRGGLSEQLGHRLDRVTGIDPDMQSLTEHRLRGTESGPRLTAGLSRQLPFASDSFDIVFASWVLEHLAQPEGDLREIGRVLRPGGAFIFITPNRDHPLSVFNRNLARMGSVQKRLVSSVYKRAGSDTFPAYYRANSRKALDRLAQEGGMIMSELECVADPTSLALTRWLFRLACRIEDWLPAERKIHLVGVMERAE